MIDLHLFVCFLSHYPDLHATTENLSTVTVVPISDDVPLDRFCLELTHAISGIGKSHHSLNILPQKRICQL